MRDRQSAGKIVGFLLAGLGDDMLDLLPREEATLR
jgi:hypothetical protein